MILGQISYLDCIVFVLLLVPQLLITIPFLELVACGLKALPFFLFYLPYLFIEGRWRPKRQQSPFVQQSSPFQDFVIRCVHYAFANFPANIGQVFFSGSVAIPFLRFRLLRHGYFKPPQEWTEINENGVRGILIQHDKAAKPDVVVYYIHGGGFAMGSAAFYLEPLLVMLTLLKPHYKNPAVFALEYSLVPEFQFPTQLTETVAGYEFALALVSGDPSRINVAGDSAGGTLVLSLLLTLAQSQKGPMTPGFVTLLSPWITLKTEKNKDTESDFLSSKALQKYGGQYAAVEGNLINPVVSPGCCTDLAKWKKSVPVNGLYITYGGEEVFAPDIRDFIKRLRMAGVGVNALEEPGAIHAWVIASLFLEDSLKERIMGMRELVKAIAANIPSG